MKGTVDQVWKENISEGKRKKGADCEPVELVEKPQVRAAFQHKALVRVQNENSSEDKAEEQDVHVDHHDSVPALQEEAAEEAPVFRVGVERQDPEVSQEGQGRGEAWE